MLVPCGKCFLCRFNISREWMVRLRNELDYHEQACFITLTYDDDHLLTQSVHKRDLQLFFKRYRKELGNVRIKYFAIGDYGGQFGRPHYHAIIFGHEPELRSLTEVTRKGSRIYYSSSFFKSLWPYGFNTVGTVTHQSIAYVCKYLMDKDGKPDGCRPRFRIMSRGLGLRYAIAHKEQLERDLSVKHMGKFVGLPLYYKRKLEIPTEVLLAKSQENNLLMESALVKRGYKDLGIHTRWVAGMNQRALDIETERKNEQRNDDF